MPSILEELRERVKQIGAALERAKEETTKAQEKQSTLEADLRAYTMALHAEERRNGVASAGKVIPLEHNGNAPFSALATSSEPTVNKSEEVRRVLKERKQGISPIDLHNELKKEGVEIGANYVYALLHKFKKSGFIKKKGKRFCWVETPETGTAGD